MSTVKFKFKKNIDIGSLMAEDDAFLEESFVLKPEYELLKDINNSKCIILGRTGTGKTALLKTLYEKETKVTVINPETLSLKYLTNSTILEYFRKLDVNLDLFYKLLWKHVFVVELLKLHFDIDDVRNRNWLQSLSDKYLKNKKKKKAIEYLNQWEDSFWEKTEYRVKEIETDLINKVSNQLGISSKIFESSASVKNFLENVEEEKRKIDITYKSEQVINEIQVEEIYDIIDIMNKDLFSNTKIKHYLLIDDLDKEWVDKKIVYDLIKNLIFAINDLNQIPQCKIIIALRENLYQIVSNQGRSRGMQREKFDQLNMAINWTKEELEILINNRLEKLMRGTYTKQSPTINDVLPNKAGRNKTGFEYILERTFMRPRDIIAFINICINNADGKTEITFSNIRKSEEKYSEKRLNSIEDEWEENYGELSVLYKFLRGFKNGFTLNDLSEDNFSEFILSENNYYYSVFTKSLRDKYYYDNDIKSLVSSILIILYKVGIIGVKIDQFTSKIIYSFDDGKNINIVDINENSKFFIHPTFHSVFRIN